MITQKTKNDKTANYVTLPQSKVRHKVRRKGCNERCFYTMLPASRLHGCRFHLGQSWWRRIQALGLSEDYKVKGATGIAQWLLLFLGCLYCRLTK